VCAKNNTRLWVPARCLTVGSLLLCTLQAALVLADVLSLTAVTEPSFGPLLRQSLARVDWTVALLPLILLFYKESGFRRWLLPLAILTDGLIRLIDTARSYIAAWGVMPWYQWLPLALWALIMLALPLFTAVDGLRGYPLGKYGLIAFGITAFSSVAGFLYGMVSRLILWFAEHIGTFLSPTTTTARLARIGALLAATLFLFIRLRKERTPK